MQFIKNFSVCHHYQVAPMRFQELIISRNLTLPAGTPGAGAGKGGGAGGSVRESGGALGKYGAAQEESYFYDKQKEQLEQFKKRMDLENEIAKKKEDQ
ncbi:Testis-specific ATPase inhibitor-like protein [Operophtera brumata]|uniref:Testis-specific ATPase inhibitor-like protein n=1 Tax=Operophtera brumata TaxID=104452 RepID=A0A0L7KUA8_OPEBR|nr:Testis-specific ATPase inhibitor-like protein [Operophtera brumata]